MKDVYLLLGSNEGRRQLNIAEACTLIALKCGTITKYSSLYETAAWGLTNQQSFINQCIIINTNLRPENLLSALKEIEKQVGRIETIKWGPRIIDIDILFYSTEIINTPSLKIPHPLLHQRRFTLVPLNEIAGSFIHPVLKKSIPQLLEECADTLPVNNLP